LVTAGTDLVLYVTAQFSRQIDIHHFCLHLGRTYLNLDCFGNLIQSMFLSVRFSNGQAESTRLMRNNDILLTKEWLA
jgi:hypothetical protein